MAIMCGKIIPENICFLAGFVHASERECHMARLNMRPGLLPSPSFGLEVRGPCEELC